MSDARLTSLGEGKGPIVLQGAMEMEVAPFIKRLKGAELEVYGDFFFWRYIIKVGHPGKAAALRGCLFSYLFISCRIFAIWAGV